VRLGEVKNGRVAAPACREAVVHSAPLNRTGTPPGGPAVGPGVPAGYWASIAMEVMTGRRRGGGVTCDASPAAAADDAKGPLEHRLVHHGAVHGCDPVGSFPLAGRLEHATGPLQVG
jgi:hypothetical protein